MNTRVIFLIVVLVMAGFGQNLLQNPGFESWTGGMPNDWEKDDSVELFQEDVIVHSGNFSAKDSFFSTEGGNAELLQGVYAQPNTLYRISFWAYDNDPSGRARAGVQWFSQGAWVASDWPNFYTYDSAGWQLWEADLQVSPSNADSVRFAIRGYDDPPWVHSAVFYVDDAYLGPPATQPPTILRHWHTPTNPGPAVTSVVYAFVIDNGTIEYDTLFYGINDLNSPTTITHVSIANDTFYYQITGQTTGDTVFYYLKYIDNDGLSAISDTNAYYVGELNIYINEIYYDTPGADSGCFTEIFGPGMTSLDGFTLVGVNGNGGVDYAVIDLAGQTIPSDGFFVIGDYSSVPNVDLVDTLANLQNAPDNLELRYYGITIDAVGYGALNGWVFTGEWLPALDVENGHSLGRFPDGHDTDNNEADFNDYDTLTPGSANPGVGISENKVVYGLLPIPRFTNPVRSGILFRNLISNIDYYPMTVYNTMGQAITEANKPEQTMALPTGVYFVRLNNTSGGCAKIVVVR
ncbi:MAG: T9SS type A sorting domain-containing protein [bacterium]